MTASNIYAGVAGYVGRPDEKGSVGVFRRGVADDKWSHVLTHLETHHRQRRDLAGLQR
jgi:hypothetical protein